MISSSLRFLEIKPIILLLLVACFIAFIGRPDLKKMSVCCTEITEKALISFCQDIIIIFCQDIICFSTYF